MKLTVKTLQGVAFALEAEPTNTVAEVKAKIEAEQGHAAAQQKLIHAGKVLKDDSPLSEYNIKENDFLVVMVTKPKVSRTAASTAASAAPAATPASASAASTPAPASASAAPASASTANASETSSTPASSAPATSAASSSTSATTSTPSAAATSAGAGAASGMDEQAEASVRQLMEMGFPEDQVRAALQAAFFNADRAVEYLMNGIPETTTAPAPGSAPSQSAEGQGAMTLEALRNHPQFNALRQLIQSNPSALPAVLQQIGSQNPELLRLIHSNQDDFVRMLNEPIEANTSSPASAPSNPSGMPDLGALGGAGGPTPQQIQQLFESLTPEQQTEMAAQMGITPEQLRNVSRMLSSLPPEALGQLMQSMGGGGAPGGMPDGSHRIMLTQEEAAAVDRLCDMGFDRGEVIQAYLACDKNEALAANFLMDSMADNFGEGTGGAGGAGNDNDDIYG